MRNIPVFISSTFSDMHQERDLLQQVAGLINLSLAHKGYQITLKDLRYGIDTSFMEDEREIERKILGECFDTIGECALFVLLLGERYGSVFEDLTIPLSYMPDMDLTGKSVTHLEVDYGILRIGKEHMLVLEREMEGDTALLPPHYREKPYGIAQNQRLKQQLHEEEYLISKYSAVCGQDGMKVDEVTFMRYAWGFLTTLVTNYIDEIEETTPENIDRSEVLNEQLQRLLEKKVTVYPKACRETAEKLILLRIQELLHMEDYAEINRFGGDGKAIVQYRSALIQNQPDDFVGLVREVCDCIEAVVPSAPAVFATLEVLACAQKSQLAWLGGVSVEQLESVCAGKTVQETMTFDQWEETWERFGGDTGKTGLKRALTYFLGKNALLTHSEDGYRFSDDAVAARFYDACSEEIKCRFQAYMASVFWYLPDPSGFLVELLTNKQYDLCLQCLQFVRADERAALELTDYLAENNLNVDFFAIAEDFANWLIPQTEVEPYILFLQNVCRGLGFDSVSDELDEEYREYYVTWAKKVHDSFYEAHKEKLSSVKLHLLDALYNDFAEELPERPDSVLTQAQKEELQALGVAYFYYYPFADDDEEQENEEDTFQIIDAIIRYHYTPDMLEELIKNCPGDHMYAVLREMILEQGLWDRAYLPRLLEANIYFNVEQIFYAIVDTVTQLIRPLMEEGDYDLCVSLVHVLYDAVCAETRLRRCQWYRWLEALNYELVADLTRLTKDPVVWDIKTLCENMMMEDLEDLDEQLLQEADMRYSALKNR